jgi:hypothetical protein
MSNERQRSLSSLKQSSVSSLVSSSIATESSFSLMAASATAPVVTASGGSVDTWEARSHSSTSLFMQADGASRPYMLDRQPLAVRPSSMSSIPSFHFDSDDDNEDYDMAFTNVKDDDFQVPLKPMDSVASLGRGSNHKNEDRQMLTATMLNASYNSISGISALTSESFGGGEDDMAFTVGMKSDMLTVPLHSLQVGGVVQKQPRRRSKDRLQLSKLTSSLRSSSFHGIMGSSISRSGVALMAGDFLEEGEGVGAPSPLLRNASWSAGGGLLGSSQRGGHMASIEGMINTGNNNTNNKDASSFRRQMLMRTSSIRGLLGSSRDGGRDEASGKMQPNELTKRQSSQSRLFGSSQHRALPTDDNGNDNDLDLLPPSSKEPEQEIHPMEEEEEEDDCWGDIPKHISVDSLEVPGAETQSSTRRGTNPRQASQKRNPNGAAHHRPYTRNSYRTHITRSKSLQSSTGSSLKNCQRSASSMTRNNSNTIKNTS